MVVGGGAVVGGLSSNTLGPAFVVVVVMVVVSLVSMTIVVLVHVCHVVPTCIAWLCLKSRMY